VFLAKVVNLRPSINGEFYVTVPGILKID